MGLHSQLESILFVASKPLSLAQLAKALSIGVAEISAAIEALKQKHNQLESGIHILRSGDEVQMATNADNASVLENFIKEEATGELTRAQLETLTVIAYRGPITKPELEQIRGVNCAVILRLLLMRGLIEEKDDLEKFMPVYSLALDALCQLGITTLAELPEYEILHTHENLEAMLKEKEAKNNVVKENTEVTNDEDE